MEWNGGTIWRLGLGLLFVLCGCGVAYAFFRLGAVLKKMAGILSSVESRVLPLLTRVEATLDGVNSELSKVDRITGSVAEMVKAAEETTTALHNVVSVPLKKLAGLAGGINNSVKAFLAARRKGQPNGCS